MLCSLDCDKHKSHLKKIPSQTKPKVYVGTVTKVLMDDEKRARGVEFVDSKGQVFQLEAKKEVILAAGVVNTPKVRR